MLHTFLSQIPPEHYQKLFKSSEVPADIFSHIVKVLIDKEKDLDLSAKIIFNLCKTKNIDMTLMMLDDKEKGLILELISKVEKDSKLEKRDEICDTIKAMLD